MVTKISRILLLLVAVCLTGRTFAVGVVDDQVEKAALLALYTSTNLNNINQPTWTRPWSAQVLADLSNPAVTLSSLAPSLPQIMIVEGDVWGLAFGSNEGLDGPLPSEILSFTKLQAMTIPGDPRHYPNFNHITGELPNLSTLPNLNGIYMPNNYCTGTIDWLGNTSGAASPLLSVDLSSDADDNVNLTIYPTDGFKKLTNLVFLTLNHCELTTSSTSVDNKVSDNFRYLNKLQTLTLNYCKLNPTSFNELADFGADDLKALKVLYLNGNLLTTCPWQIGKLGTLRSLYLDNNNLTSFASSPDGSIGELDNLATLSLASNGMTDATLLNIVPEIKECSLLTILNLNNNNLKYLSSNFKDLVSLKTLYLNSNPIEDSDLSNLEFSNISKLTLEACKLTTSVPSKLLNMPYLSNLDLGNASLGVYYNTNSMRNLIDLNQVQGTMQALTKKLDSLSLNWHAIAGAAGPLPDWFGSVSNAPANLSFLDIRDESITLPFPPAFRDPTHTDLLNLKTLWADNNPLGRYEASYPFNISALANLTNVSLRNFDIYVDADKFNVFPDLSPLIKLRVVDISYNSLDGALPDYYNTVLTKLYGLTIVGNNIDAIPDFMSNEDVMHLMVNAGVNALDLVDLDKFYTSSCAGKIYSLQYGPQKKATIGVERTYRVPEGMQITLQFKIDGMDNANYSFLWEYNNGGVWIPVSGYLPADATGTTSYTITNATAANTGAYRTRIKSTCMPQFENGGTTFWGANVYLMLTPPLCQTVIPKNKAGKFKYDKFTGTIVFQRDDCPTRIPISCVFGPSTEKLGVISASAVTFSDKWSQTDFGLPSTGNPFATGQRGKWRAQASYTYNTKLDQSKDKNFNGGTFQYKTFNWILPEKSNNPGWLKVTQVEKYSPHGDPIQERNALNIASTAKFGYNNAVPYLVAQNADYQSVLFEGFENLYGINKFEDGFTSSAGTIDKVVHHSGKASYKITAPQLIMTRTFTASMQLRTNGIQAKVWAKGLTAGTLALQAFGKDGTALGSDTFEWIAQSGEWSLYEAFLVPTFGNAPPFDKNDAPFDLKITSTGSATMWLDDLRIQPKDSEMTTYVYDPATLRLLTVFDDQHFGLYYQYNSEGKLIRKSIETNRGIRTVQETQYNTPTVAKP